MRRLTAALAACLLLSACSAEELVWFSWFGRPAPGLPCAQWVGTARVAGFTDTELPAVQRIMFRESRCDPDAIGPTDDHGLMQIHGPWIGSLCGAGIACSRLDLLDPQTNLNAARYVYDVQGWRAWATHP